MGMISYSEFLEIVFRHQRKIVLIPLVILSVTFAILLFFPRKYRSEAKLFLQVGRESLGMDATATMGPTANLIQNNRDEEVKSALQIIGSRGVIAQVVETLGSDYVLTCVDPGKTQVPGNRFMSSIKQGLGHMIAAIKSIDPVSKDEEAMVKLEKNLRIETQRNSMVLTISLDADSPRAAQKILDTLVDVYRSEHLRIHRNRHSGNFLADQRNLLLDQYTKAQESVRQAKNEFSISSIEGRRQSLEARLQSIELEKIQNLRDLTSCRAKAVELKTQLSQLPERETSAQKSLPNEGADLLRRELYTNQMRLMDQKSRLTSDHPEFIATSQQLEDARRLLETQEVQRKEIIEDINPIYRTLALDLRQQESLLAGWVAKQKEIVSQHAEIISALESFNSQVIELTQLEHEEQIARDKYLQYSNSLEQARIDKALEDGKISSVSIAQKATFSEKPVSPNKLLVLFGGTCIAIASVLGSVFLSEKMNDRIRNERELSNWLGLPVFAAIPDSSQHKRILANLQELAPTSDRDLSTAEISNHRLTGNEA
jgi:polysaccharide biosynthesis protein PslE